MNGTKRLLAFRLHAMDPKGGEVTFALESEGGGVQAYAASNDVLGGLLRFIQDIEYRARQRPPTLQAGEAPAGLDLLHPAEALDVFLDLREGRALLRASVGRGKTVQLELSEEVLVRLEESIPSVLAALRNHKHSH